LKKLILVEIPKKPKRAVDTNPILKKNIIVCFILDQKKLKREARAQNIHNKKRFNTKNRTKRKVIEQKQERLEIFKTFTKQEEVDLYLEAEKMQKVERLKNAKKGLEQGLKVLIDFSYEGDMEPKEINSLCLQICICCGWMKKIQNPVSLNLVNCNEILEERLFKMGLKNWALNIFKKDIMEIDEFALRKNDMIYLSPDSNDELESIEEDKIYIIGGLVDRTIRKYASLIRAKDLGIRTGKLPINKFMALTRRKPLNIDTVVLLLADMLETKNWEKSFLKVCPKRLLLPEEEKKEEMEDER